MAVAHGGVLAKHARQAASNTREMHRTLHRYSIYMYVETIESHTKSEYALSCTNPVGHAYST